MAELVDQPLTSLRLLHDPLLVVLSQRPGKLVIVHRWSVLGETNIYIIIIALKSSVSTNLSLSPQGGHLDRVNDLEDALLPVDPVDVVAVEGGLQQQLLDKLPQVDVCAWP